MCGACRQVCGVQTYLCCWKTRYGDIATPAFPSSYVLLPNRLVCKLCGWKFHVVWRCSDFIAKEDTQIQNLPFQRGFVIPDIHLDGFHLTLTELYPDNDVCIYVYNATDL
jgi:hypothetical protein